MDTEIGNLLDALEAEGALENTLIIFLGNNDTSKDERLTASGMVMGTVPYLSPENSILNKQSGPGATSDQSTPTEMRSFQKLILKATFEAALTLLQTGSKTRLAHFTALEKQLWIARLYQLRGQKNRTGERLFAATTPPNERNRLALALMENDFPGRAGECLGTSESQAKKDEATSLVRAVSALKKQWVPAQTALTQARDTTTTEEWAWWRITDFESTDPVAAINALQGFMDNDQAKVTRPDRWVLSHLKPAENYRRRRQNETALLWYNRFLNQWAAFPNDETHYARKQRDQLQRRQAPQAQDPR